ncbi:MAG: sigma-54 dependent transcriptional regulator, partial [Myxococcota bacterium]
ILDRVAPSELSVVIEGETGTGKELIAKAIHDNSLRAAGPFAVFDCSAFPPSLLESELFGHERGAFTGAMDRYRGVFERADGGTLFFDELGELDLEFQAKFLRVLETGQVRRVGAESAMQVNVRVVAATNRNLEEMVRKKVFRPDLFYRLAQVRFLLPPLRERLEDIVPLLEHFLEQHAGRTGRHPFLASEAMRVLQGYEWPGNIRELRNVLEKAVALSRGGVLTAEYFRGELDGFDDGFDSDPFGPRRLASSASHAGVPEPERAYADAPMVDAQGGVRPFKDVKEELISSFERQYLEMLLGRTGMNISRASRQAGIDRRHFYRLLKKHGIDPSR